MIPYGRQDISQADIDAVVEVLRSDFLTQGPMVPRFEEVVAQYCDAQHAVAMNSATSALHIACLALDLGRGDWLWTSPNSFVASANCALYCGAKVDFIDIDPRTYNMSVELLKEKLEQAEKEACLPKIVIPVHFSGQPCDMPAIYALSQQYGFKIIEDASHAIGASYRVVIENEPASVITRSCKAATKQSTSTKVGSCAHSHITIFSFHPVKIITTGEGGMAMTKDAGLANRMRRLRTHGITRDPAQMVRESAGPWYYEQLELGYNYRMTDLQAALGISQMQRLDEFVELRNTIASRYGELLADLPLRCPKLIAGAHSSWHLYSIRLQLDRITRSHREVFKAMRDAGIGVNVHYMPIHLQPYYQALGFREGMFPEAEDYGSDAISLPIYPGLTDGDFALVIDALQRAVNA